MITELLSSRAGIQDQMVNKSLLNIYYCNKWYILFYSPSVSEFYKFISPALPFPCTTFSDEHLTYSLNLKKHQFSFLKKAINNVSSQDVLASAHFWDPPLHQKKAMIGLKTNTPKPKKQKQNEKALVIGEISEI